MNSNDMEVVPTGKYYRQNKVSDIVSKYVLDNGVELDKLINTSNSNDEEDLELDKIRNIEDVRL